MVQSINESTHQELLALTPSGDLMDLARQLRARGVESLLICRPGGRISQVVTDRQIAALAAPDIHRSPRFKTPLPAIPAPRPVPEYPVPTQTVGRDADLIAAQAPALAGSPERKGIRGQSR